MFNLAGKWGIFTALPFFWRQPEPSLRDFFDRPPDSSSFFQYSFLACFLCSLYLFVSFHFQFCPFLFKSNYTQRSSGVSFILPSQNQQWSVLHFIILFQNVLNIPWPVDTMLRLWSLFIKGSVFLIRCCIQHLSSSQFD